MTQWPLVAFLNRIPYSFLDDPKFDVFLECESRCRLTVKLNNIITLQKRKLHVNLGGGPEKLLNRTFRFLNLR